MASLSKAFMRLDKNYNIILAVYVLYLNSPGSFFCFIYEKPNHSVGLIFGDVYCSP